MKTLLFTLLVFCNCFVLSQDYTNIISISDDIKLIKISDNAYVHITYASTPQFGKFPCDGLLFINNSEAFLFDTPMIEEQTEDLVTYIQDSLKVKITGFAPNHWHADCTAGMAYLHSIGVASYANQMTIDIMKEKNLPVPQNGFKDSLIVNLGDKDIILNYFGAGHSTDNIVAYIPSEKILFGGCMVKETKGNSMGNLSDAVVEEWPKTIGKVLDRYRDAEIVIPGHGDIGGVELLKHTLSLLNNHLQKTNK